MALAKLHPIGCLEFAGIVPVEENLAIEVLAIANNEAAKRAFSGAAAGFNQIGLSLFETDLLTPYITLNVSPLQEDIGERVIELDAVHFPVRRL